MFKIYSIHLSIWKIYCDKKLNIKKHYISIVLSLTTVYIEKGEEGNNEILLSSRFFF